MDSTRRWLWCIAPALVGLTIMQGCTDRPRSTALSSAASQDAVNALIGAARDTGMTIVAFAVRDTFVLGDRITIGYLVRNYGAAKVLRMPSRFFEVAVFDSVGAPVASRTKEWYGVSGTMSDVLIPRGGIVGQVIDLACGDIGVDDIESCDHRFEFTSPGVYSATISYAPPRPPDDGNPLYPTLKSRAVRFVVVPSD